MHSRVNDSMKRNYLAEVNLNLLCPIFIVVDHYIVVIIIGDNGNPCH